MRSILLLMTRKKDIMRERKREDWMIYCEDEDDEPDEDDLGLFEPLSDEELEEDERESKGKIRKFVEEAFVIVPDRCLDFFATIVSVVEVTIGGTESVSLLCS